MYFKYVSYMYFKKVLPLWSGQFGTPSEHIFQINLYTCFLLIYYQSTNNEISDTDLQI